MKVSFVATVFNEEKTIGVFLDSLIRQTKMPDEIVIVDGGSVDNTLSKIFNFLASRRSGQFSIFNKKSKSKNIKFKIFSKPGLTIAQGRNYGIKKAIGDIIAMSDAGCILHKDWLEKITKPFNKKDADVVAGFYRMTGSSPIQNALAVYLGIPWIRFDQNKFLPSARSMAFRKTVWKKIGGFNEKLDRAGEDTMFNYQAIKLGVKIIRVKDALVDWEVPKSLWEGIKKFYVYAKGDVQTGIWWHPTQRISTHNFKIFNIFLRYALGILLFVFSFKNELAGRFLLGGLILYILWSVWKMRDVGLDLNTKLWLPIVQIASDIAVLLGTGLGILRKH